MKRMKLLFTLALPVILIQNVQAQSVVEKTTSSVTISRLIGIADWVNSGAMFNYNDSTVLTYSNPRGGDLTHLLKYDNRSSFVFSGFDSLYHNNTLNQQTFDANNNISSNQLLNWTGSSTGWVAQTKNLYYYDASNKMTGQIMQSWNSGTGTWVPVSQDTYIYNPGTSLLFSDLYYVWNNLTLSFDGAAEKLFYYDINGNQLEELDQVSSGASWVPSAKFDYTYNIQNQTLTSTYSTWTGGNYVNSYQYSYTYDSVAPYNMKTMLYQIYDTIANTWKNTTLNIYASYSGTSVMTEYQETWNDTLAGGSWQPQKQYTYTYNSGFGQMTSKTTTSWNVTGFYEFAFGDPRTNYYYESVSISGVKDVENSGVNVSIYPVPAQNMLHINLDANEALSYDIAIIDMNGRVMRSWSVPSTSNYTTAIAIGNYATGNYIVKINSAKGLITKQLTVVH